MTRWLFLSILFLLTFVSSAQTFRWGVVNEVTDECDSYDISLLPDGNLLVMGWHQGTTKFEFTNNKTVSTKQGYRGNYLQKMSPNGEKIWLKFFGKNSYSFIRDVVNDKKGNLVCIGVIHGEVDFDMGPGKLMLGIAAQRSQFIMKMDVYGNPVWVKLLTKTPGVHSFPNLWEIEIDNNNDIILGGNFTGTIDLDPDTGQFLVHSPKDRLYQYDAGFVTKLDENGKFIWGGSFGGVVEWHGDPVPIVSDIKTDAQNNIYVCGHTLGHADFDPSPDSIKAGGSLSETSGYLVKWNPNGKYQWVRTVESNSQKYTTCHAKNISINKAGEVILQGLIGYDSYIKLDTLYNKIKKIPLTTATRSTFIARFNKGGEIIQVEAIEAFTTHMETVGNDIFLHGMYTNLADMAPGARVMRAQTVNKGFRDVFVLRLKQNMDVDWFAQTGSASANYARGIAVDDHNNVYLTGKFGFTLDLDPTFNGNWFKTAFEWGKESSFIAKWSSCEYNKGKYAIVSKVGLYELKATRNNGIYQWYDCDLMQIVPGMTSPIFQPSISGNYALIQDDGVNCLDTSECIYIDLRQSPVSKNEITNDGQDIQVYPNPTNGVSNINSVGNSNLKRILVFSSLGNQVMEIKINSTGTYDFSKLSTGIYTLQLETEESSFFKKLVIEH